MTPPELGQLTNLTQLVLTGNKLEGASVYVQFDTKEANRGTFLACSLHAQVRSRLSSGG